MAQAQMNQSDRDEKEDQRESVNIVSGIVSHCKKTRKESVVLFLMCICHYLLSDYISVSLSPVSLSSLSSVSLYSLYSFFGTGRTFLRRAR